MRGSRRAQKFSQATSWLAALVASLAGGVGHVHAATAEDLEFFEKKIRPVLSEQCFKCHSATAEKVKGGLLLDTRDALLKGGESGAAVVPGNPEASLLIKAVRYTDKDLQMPPKNKKLSDAQIADLETWVKQGVPYPETVASGRPDPMALARTHWAFQPVKAATPPAVKNQQWPRVPIDFFILAKLEEKGLKPAPPADKATLLRRVTYDLTGLPPSPREVSDFLADKSPKAFERVVDRLL
ncbi:MAG TPA: DUF1549 domain-containing protein, partial [Verrucomicrobiae bacterium]|nr:DUF1549 domain-containing protein [Verrucomicrobiae bacterium]